jgi:hypothetical protein
LDELSQKWMAYIDSEVRAACRTNGLGCQVRRKWAVRAKPVSESPVDDYEWKLIPGADRSLREQQPRELDEGTYYVLGFDRHSGKFIFQHDTRLGGAEPRFGVRTFTEIELLAFNNLDYMRNNRDHIRLWHETGGGEQGGWAASPPPVGWLREFLVDLTRRFQPNSFSLS